MAKKKTDTAPATVVTDEATENTFVKLNMAKSLHRDWTNGEFGVAPKENIIKVFAENGVVPDGEGVLTLADTEENRKVLRRARVIGAKEASEKLAELKAKLSDLRKFNKDILEGANGPAFETAIKNAEVLASVNVINLGLRGQRDFRETLNAAQAAYKEAQPFVLPKLQARLARMFNSLEPENQALVAEKFATTQTADARVSDVLSLTTHLRKNGVEDPEKVSRDAERGGHQDKGFGNRPKFSPGSPYPKTRRGQGSQRSGRRHNNEDAEDRSL